MPSPVPTPRTTCDRALGRFAARTVLTAFALVAASVLLASCVPASSRISSSDPPLGAPASTPSTTASTTPASGASDTATAQTGSSAAQPPGKAGYRLVFSDEFEGTTLDGSKWAIGVPWGFTTNNQDQRYQSEAAQVRDGMLNLIASRGSSGWQTYKSGAVHTAGSPKIRYGYIEMRAKVPPGKGLWPAFWLEPEPGVEDSEIDVMEILGRDPRRTYMWLHMGKATSPNQPHTSFRGPDFSADYHIFAIDWEPNSIVWYVDGVERYRFNGKTPKAPMRLIANLTVGLETTWGDAPDESTKLPAVYSVERI